jgi:hypothetical protein
MDAKNIPTRRTLIIRKPDLNNFERYKIDPRFTINKIKEQGAFKQFMSHNPLPYYTGEPMIEGGSFWSDFADGFQKGFSTTLDIGSKLLPLVGLGADGEMEGCGKKKAKRGGARKKKVVEKSESEESEQEEIEHEIKENKQLNKIEKITKDMKKANKKILRGEMIRDLMKKHNMTLGQASRHIKENKLM